MLLDVNKRSNLPTLHLLQVEGRELPVLCTLSRDGAFFTWTFTPSLALSGGGSKRKSSGKQQQSHQNGVTVVEGAGPQPKRQRLADGDEAQRVSAFVCVRVCTFNVYSGKMCVAKIEKRGHQPKRQRLHTGMRHRG